MDVECTIWEYIDKPGQSYYDTNKVAVRSVFADGNKVEIVIDGKPHKFVISELTAAVERCRLDCFGR